MCSKPPKSFEQSGSLSCFIHTFMDGIILQDKPLVIQRIWEALPEEDRNDDEINNPRCTFLTEDYESDVTVSKHATANQYQNVSRTKELRNSLDFRLCRHFRFSEMKVLMIALLFLIHSTCCMDNNILQLNIPTEEPVIDPNTVCKTFPELSTKQYRLCAKYPDVTASAIQGIQIAIHECQHQLKEHRWNCSSLERKNKNPHSSPMLRKGYKESAFAYAISAAGVAHQVSKACSMGKLQSCGCDMSQQGQVKDRFEWGGCSHNVQFGVAYAKKFTSARESARDIRARVNIHNNRVGRMAIVQNVQRQCKCHGMSGSCEIKTCWKVAPNFRDVGNILKHKYRKANRVNFNNHADSRSKRRLVRKQSNTQLVFYEKSPNFCNAIATVDSPGTTGRFCNKTSKGVDNCDTLCCGRGYNTLRVRRSERCNCKFHWCCYVVCQTCTYNEWVTVCK